MAKRRKLWTEEEERRAFEKIQPKIAAAFQLAQLECNFKMEDWERISSISSSYLYRVLNGNVKSCKPYVAAMMVLSLPKEVQHAVNLRQYYSGFGDLWFWSETPRDQAIMGLNAIAAALSNDAIAELNREWVQVPDQAPEKDS